MNNKTKQKKINMNTSSKTAQQCCIAVKLWESY